MNETLPLSLVPSLPAQAIDELLTLGETLQGIARGFQVDIVDGRFVETTSWPFTETDPIAALASLAPLSAHFDLAVDCMVIEPERFFLPLLEVGVDRVLIHLGSTDMEAAIANARLCELTVAMAFTNDADLETVRALIPLIDYVQVMGIAEVGKQGQPFDERTLDTVSTLRAEFPDLTIAVDGSVNEDTIVPLLKAGANRFAPGSAIAKADDPVEAFATLATLIGLQQPKA